MLLPALNKACEKARSSSCMSNLKQLGIALSSYSTTHNDYLVPYLGSSFYFNMILEEILPRFQRSDALAIDRYFSCPSCPKDKMIGGKTISGWMTYGMTRPYSSSPPSAGSVSGGAFFSVASAILQATPKRINMITPRSIILVDWIPETAQAGLSGLYYARNSSGAYDARLSFPSPDHLLYYTGREFYHNKYVNGLLVDMSVNAYRYGTNFSGSSSDNFKYSWVGR